MYLCSKNPAYIDHTMKGENLRCQNNIKCILCPFTRMSEIRNSPFHCSVDVYGIP